MYGMQLFRTSRNPPYNWLSQPAVRPDCARCRSRALKVTQNNWFLCRICKTVAPKKIYLLHHGDSFILPFKVRICHICLYGYYNGFEGL